MTVKRCGEVGGLEGVNHIEPDNRKIALMYGAASTGAHFWICSAVGGGKSEGKDPHRSDPLIERNHSPFCCR